MAVPDWPTTYGYNMFFFPISHWVGGVFYEHTHRLFASFVGLLTTILAVWVGLKESRGWVRILAGVAFILVVAQGVLGGLRVVLIKDQIGILHGMLAQTFLVVVSLIAFATSRAWRRLEDSSVVKVSASVRSGLSLAMTLVFLQLVLGATMRHQHAGLAVPDFPLAYGKVCPALDDASIERINQGRVDVGGFKPVTAFQIVLHMAHRFGAVAALIAVAASVWRVRKEMAAQPQVVRLASAWLVLILCQAGLGAATVWSDKAADITTAHVVGGAISLVVGGILVAATRRLHFLQTGSATGFEAGFVRREASTGRVVSVA